MTNRVIRAALAMLCACTIGCIPSPKKDPCRGPDAGRPAHCEPDAIGVHDGAPEAGPERMADAGTPSDAVRDAALPPVHEDDADAGFVAPDAEAFAEDAGRDSGDAPSPTDAGPLPEPRVLELSGDLGVHDPTIIQADGAFTIFSTGPGIQVKRSSDLLAWQNDGRVFATNPAWIAKEVPGASDLWAPDIAYFGGVYHLYYSASTFGSQRSCIGHATATDLATLDFVDHGPVICTSDSDDYNAIDPAFSVDTSGTPWLTFGSFWSGIKLIRLDAEGKRSGTELYPLASRDAVEAIEAPYLVRHGSYFYLFASFDLCCRGSASTYRVMVGRSKSVTGPYVDRSGTPMLSAGGGTSVVLGDQRWHGPGHNAVLTVGAEQYLVYHAYDAEHGGAPTLRIAELLWDDAGWPIPAGP